LDECCVRDDPDASVTNDKLFKVYQDWCEGRGERFPLPLIQLKRKLFAMLGNEIKPDRSDKKVRSTKGLGMKPDNELPFYGG
jgi:phage/plasmid-associated DNA primase